MKYLFLFLIKLLGFIITDMGCIFTFLTKCRCRLFILTFLQYLKEFCLKHVKFKRVLDEIEQPGAFPRPVRYILHPIFCVSIIKDYVYEYKLVTLHCWRHGSHKLWKVSRLIWHIIKYRFEMLKITIDIHVTVVRVLLHNI